MSLFLTNQQRAALINKVKKKNLRALKYVLSFMEIEGKTLGFLLFCIFTTPVSQEAPQTFVFLCQLSPTKA